MRIHLLARPRCAAFVTVALLALAGADTPAAAQGVGYTGSVYVARTTYPAATPDRATSVSLFNSVDVTAGPVRLAVSIPWIRRETTFTEGVIDPVTGIAGLEGTSTGFGDPFIRVDVRVLNDRTHDVDVRIAGSVKPALVDPEDGLGTGEVDVAAGGSIAKGIGRSSIFADVLFWKYGDPEGIDFEDSLSYGVGISRLLGSGRWSVMGSLFGFSQGIAGAAPPLQANIAFLLLANRHQSLAFTTGVDLTGDSEGVSFATSWRISR